MCYGLVGAWKKKKLVEQVYWINRAYIQNKSVSTADRSVCPNCQVWLLGESLSESKIRLVFMKEEEFIIV